MARKTAKSVGSSSANQLGKQQNQTAGQQDDPIAMLKADHRKVEGLFKKYEQLQDDEQKRDIVQKICQELIIHSMLEEEIFYPACRQKGGADEDAKDGLDEAQVEHDGAKTLINELLNQSPNSEFYDAKVTVLAQYIKHHVDEEEKPSDGLFAKAQKAGIDMNALGERLQARKTALLEQAEEERLPAPRPRSIHTRSSQDRHQEEDDMNQRSNYRDRDEQGRFASDDDDRGDYRSRSSSSRRSASRYDDDDDRDYRRSSASRYEDDDDGRRGSPGGRQGGWFGESEGHSRAARSRSESRYGSRGGYDDDRDRGGWFGDPEGHSEASRRGWESRGGGRSRYDDDDDRAYRSQAARSRGGGGYQDEDDRRGWYGDPEGHSEASRRGWESRGGGRGRDDDDDRSRSRGGRGEGQGGWFGDSRGHAQAARRGWRDRD
jgi:hemerythrin superfamily protein